MRRCTSGAYLVLSSTTGRLVYNLKQMRTLECEQGGGCTLPSPLISIEIKLAYQFMLSDFSIRYISLNQLHKLLWSGMVTVKCSRLPTQNQAYALLMKKDVSVALSYRKFQLKQLKLDVLPREVSWEGLGNLSYRTHYWLHLQ